MPITKRYSEGVEITYPTGYEDFTVIRRDKGSLPAGVSGRIVMRFDFKNPKTKKKHKDPFKQDFKIRVEYKKIDMDRAKKEKKNLTLKVDRGQGFQKIVPNPPLISYTHKQGGYAEFKTKDWDPAVGWFP